MSAKQRLSLTRLEDRTVPSGTYSFNGVGNNPLHPLWGSAGVQLIRVAPAAYGGGGWQVGGTNRPSPRIISNVVVDQGDQDIISDRLLSAMIYAWGQFIDHDLDLTPTSGTEILDIPVPAGDPYFDPFNTGTQVIRTSRSVFDPATGTSVSNPRQQINVITAWLDGSMIYGSDEATALALRTMQGGRLKTSTGNLLPINNLATFPNGTLPMDNNSPSVPDDEMFAAGDVRANENIELTALHTLLVREHNYWAGRIAAANPQLSDEQIYQRARSRVIAEIQAITCNEWLPALLGPNAMPRYTGFRPHVNPGIANEFSTAGFRVGHSMLGDDVEFLDNQGLPVGEEVPLSGAFFNPELVHEFGIDPILKYLASDPASEIDNRIVNSVRNFLFGPPGAGGFDLASLNIARGRDHGLPDYNTVRQAYGLPRITSYAQISSDPEVRQALESLYGSAASGGLNRIDLWVGALAENHVPGGSVGPTLRAIIVDQFVRLRDGDPYWYQRAFSGATLRDIDSTTLSDVMRRNTTLSNLQTNAFFFRASISGTVFGDRNNNGRLDRGESGLAFRTIELFNTIDGEVVGTGRTDRFGRYALTVADGLRTGVYAVRVLNSSGAVVAASRDVAITRGEQFIAPVNIGVPPGSGGRPFVWSDEFNIDLSGVDLSNELGVMPGSRRGRRG